MNDEKMTAAALETTLWETVKLVRAGDMTPARASAVASNVREILRQARLRVYICEQSGAPVPASLVEYARGGE